MTEQNRRFLLWQCTPTAELRGKKEQEAFCMKWQVRRSARPMRMGANENHKMQMKCIYCDNRPRKDEGSVWVYESRETAEAECARRNSPKISAGDAV